MFNSPSRTALMLAIAGPMLLPLPAVAFDPSGNPIADRLLETVDAGNATVTGYAGVSEAGGVTTISGLEATMVENGDQSRLRIETTEIENGTIGDDGALNASTMRMQGVAIESSEGDDVSITVSSIAIADAVLPAPDKVQAAAGADDLAPSYSRAELTEILIESDDAGSIPIARAVVAIDAMDGDLPTAGSIQVDDIQINAEALDDDERAALADFGYESLTLSGEVRGTWDPETGALSIEKLTFSGENAGTLNASLKLSGVTRQLVEQLDAAQDNPQQAMGLMQGLLLEGLSIRLDNDTLAERILDKQAKDAGVTREAFVSQLTGAMPMLLSVLNNPEFQNQVAGAATTFLNDPKALEVTASPQSPVPFAAVLGAAMMAPQSIPTLLGVSIAANN